MLIIVLAFLLSFTITHFAARLPDHWGKPDGQWAHAQELVLVDGADDYYLVPLEDGTCNVVPVRIICDAFAPTTLYSTNFIPVIEAQDRDQAQRRDAKGRFLPNPNKPAKRKAATRNCKPKTQIAFDLSDTN